MIPTRRAFWGPAGCFFWTVRRYTWRIETVVKNVTDMAGSERCVSKLPQWCQVFEGMSDEEISALERDIVRDVGGRFPEIADNVSSF